MPVSSYKSGASISRAMKSQARIRYGSRGMARSKRGRSTMSHDQVMERRWKRKKVKTGTKRYHLAEFMKISGLEEGEKKTCARSIMDIVEDINEEGMNDMRYMNIMNLLMSLHKEDDDMASGFGLLMENMIGAAQRHRFQEPERGEWLHDHLRNNTIQIIRDIDTPYVPNPNNLQNANNIQNNIQNNIPQGPTAQEAQEARDLIETHDRIAFGNAAAEIRMAARAEAEAAWAAAQDAEATQDAEAAQAVRDMVERHDRLAEGNSAAEIRQADYDDQPALDAEHAQADLDAQRAAAQADHYDDLVAQDDQDEENQTTWWTARRAQRAAALHAQAAQDAERAAAQADHYDDLAALDDQAALEAQAAWAANAEWR